jgi:ABC-2 type transport system ATP-binding protein
MRQRLGIAGALLRAPRLLLLDEPTSGLDPAGARQVGALLHELAGQGVAVLVSSHLIGEVEQVCDSFTVLHRGRVVWNGTVEELRAHAPASAYALLTSDDEAALAIASAQPGVRAGRSGRGGLALAVEQRALDPFVIDLGRAGIAVRRLELLVSPLESMFFALTGDVSVSELDPEELAEKALAAT